MYVCKCGQGESAACYVAIATYIAMSSGELTVHKGELLEMVANDVTVGSSSGSSVRYDCDVISVVVCNITCHSVKIYSL